MIEEARAERARLIAKTEVVHAANREAERVVEDARERARQIRLEAEDYVDAKLANFEVVLQKVLGSVERGREKLRGRLDADQLAADLADEDEGGPRPAANDRLRGVVGPHSRDRAAPPAPELC